MPSKVEASELLCPFTGRPIDIVILDGGGFMGRVQAVEGGYSTRIFNRKSELRDFLRMRSGKLRGKPETVKIEVREPSLVDDPERAEKEKERDLHEITQVVAESTVRAVRDGKLPR